MSDKHSLVEENISLELLPKRLWVSKKATSTKHQTDYSICPNYVEHEGQYYHMAEFLSLQEGKVYHPATSRLACWMESARNDFYEINMLKAVPTWTMSLHCGFHQKDYKLAISQDCQITLLKIELSGFRMEIRLKKNRKGNHLLQGLNFEKKLLLGGKWYLLTPLIGVMLVPS